MALALGLALGAGCADEARRDAAPAGTVPGSPLPTVLVLPRPVLFLGGLAREPMWVEHPDGTLFVAGYGSQVTGVDPRSVPNLWQSSDGGETWSRVDVGTAEQGAIGNSDVDLAIGPDGTLYFVAMGFDRSTFAGTHIAIGVSPDVGGTWTWTLLSAQEFADRPWVEVTPDGTAHVIWNAGDGVHHAVSSDGGRHWSEREKVHPEGGSSHLAAGPQGEIAVRVVPLSASGRTFDEGVELIAVSRDGGVGWEKHPAPGARDWDPSFSDPGKVPRWVEPLAWDEAGALYHLWSSGLEMRLARSTDSGASWQEWVVAGDADVAYFPYLAARGPGELAAAWFSGSGDDMAVQVALIRLPDGADGPPTVLRVTPLQPEIWQQRDGARSREAGGEYVPVGFLADGDLAVVMPIQNAQDERFGFSWQRVEVD
jgi:hypothetical protein